MGKGSFKYAYLLDTHKYERERGITMINHSRHLEMEKTIISLIDTPGYP